jgi:hypothetical protein
MSQLDLKLVEAGKVANTDEITSSYLALQQWANGDLLNDPALGFDTVYAVSSMREIGMNWLSPPEISMSGCTTTIPVAVAVELFTPITEAEDTHTLLSPENVF